MGAEDPNTLAAVEFEVYGQVQGNENRGTR